MDTTETPAPGPRVPITTLIRPDALAWLDSKRTASIRRADVVRVSLAVARRHEKELDRALAQLEEVD